MKVLIVEDNKKLAKSVGYILEESGYTTTVAFDGETGLELSRNENFDLIILDIMLPGIDGVEVCRQMRLDGLNTPIIMLTAKDSVSSKIEGFDGGADAYMTKPFTASELLAHLRALQRRTGQVEFETISYLDLSLHFSTHELTCGNNSVHLTKKEFDVMHMLINQKGTAIPKQEILKNIWKQTEDQTDNNVRTYISFLRDKLELIESKTTIQAISKAGYRLIETSSLDK